ncbi:MAG TPA: FKBP-type peptidyl-prolyl cis-trans isomerase [Gammaproteobacteria bacterium]|jgi:FKBP-type peptidyl-prolyl cis-trans isomerase|nr:FKBP-type peptidyl-prolyl cis-trans isomerase [Gammaproteobacteria bacterium]
MPLRSLALISAVTCGLVACSSMPPAPLNPGQTLPVKPADAIVLPDGLTYKVLRPGTGTQHPVLSDQVTANYSLWYPDGRMIESSCKPDGSCEPATFPLNVLIPGWQEAIPLMTVGETIDLWLPVQLAYGDPPRKPDRPFGPLVFEIQLISIGQPVATPAPEQQK